MKISFLGGAESVTGAQYLLEHGKARILVDCGLFQGGAALEKENEEPFGFDPATIHALFVTHSHIDHIGRIPLLVKNGFRGAIYSTPPTKDVSYELLLDAHTLMTHQLKEREAPLYDVVDIDRAMELWKTVRYHEPFSVSEFRVEFFNSGHILGSAFVRIEAGGKTIVFSGDLGNAPAPLVKDYERVEFADYAVIESAYGGRLHGSKQEGTAMLEDIIEDVVKERGTLIIPAFAMERTQELLYELNSLIEHGRIPRVPVFIDSPLAIRLTSIYEKYIHDADYFDDEVQRLRMAGDEILNFSGLRFTLTTEESKEINTAPPPKIIIAGSGNSQGGRILHHEKRYLSDPHSVLLFVGYQTEGSLGRRILDGEKEVFIMGDRVPILARVEEIESFSAHADQAQLMEWASSMRRSLKKLFVVQGEIEQSNALAHIISDVLAIDAVVPQQGDVYEL